MDLHRGPVGHFSFVRSVTLCQVSATYTGPEPYRAQSTKSVSTSGFEPPGVVGEESVAEQPPLWSQAFVDAPEPSRIWKQPGT